MSSAAPQVDPWTIEAVLRWATDDFRSRGIETPRLDAEVLLAHALASTRIRLVVDSKKPLETGELGRFRDLVKRRRAREPTAYILGSREFYGRTFRVDRRVLVPRPDTEALVETALLRTRPASMSMRALDLCTGSGCVALTLARERPTSAFVATDVSEDALAVARDNAARLGAYNVAFRRGDLFAAVDPSYPFDLVTANAPYITSRELSTLMPDVRDFEPRLALDGGADGLDGYRTIAKTARQLLSPDGVLVLELGIGQLDAVEGILAAAGLIAVGEPRHDLLGIARALEVKLSP